MKTYLLPIKVEPDEEEEGNWFAEVPILAGCALSCYPLEHVLDSIQDMAQTMLEMMIEYGDQLPEGLDSCETAPGRESAYSMEAISVSV